MRVFCFFVCLSKSQQHDRHPYFLDTLNEERFHSFVDALAPKQKSTYKRSKRYKDKVGAFQALREFAEEVEASKARGQTSWGLDSFSSRRPVAKVSEEDQNEDGEVNQESESGGEGVDAKCQAEVGSNMDESDESDSAETRTAPPVKVKVRLTKRIASDEKRSAVKTADARRAEQRAAEAKRLARASDVQLAVIANNKKLGDMVKLEPKVRKDLVSALVDVKLRELEPTSVLHEVEKLVNDFVKSSIANLKAFPSLQVPQKVVRLKFDLTDIAKASTDEDFGRLYIEIARVLNSDDAHQLCINEAEAALGLLFEQYKKVTKGEEEQQHASFYAITVEKLPKGMEKRTESYFKRRVLGGMVFAALYDTFHAFRHAKRAVRSWLNNYTKIFKALTSAGAEYDALRMKLLTAGGRAADRADMIRLQVFKDRHGVDKKCQGK